MAGTAVHETPRILVVDDDPMNRRLAEIILSNEGYGVELAGTARRALQSITFEPPQLIMLDLVLPDMHGLKLLELLAAENLDIPVLVVSGDISAQARSADLKATEYLMKPYDPQCLVEAVARLTGDDT